MEDEERSTTPAPVELNDPPAPAPTEAVEVADPAPPESASADPLPADQTVMSDGSQVVDDQTVTSDGSQLVDDQTVTSDGSQQVDEPPATWDSPASATATATAARPPVRRPALKGRGGTAGIFAGVAIIAPVLIRELALGSEPFLLLPVSMIALAIALSGFRVAQGGRDGKLGRLGLIIAVVGALVLTIMFSIMAYNDLVLNTRLQSGSGIIQFGFYTLLAGIVIFGAATLVAGVITRGPTLLMMVSLVLGLILDSIGAFPGLRFRWGPEIVLGQGMHYGLKIFGLSLIWLGYSILKDTKARAAAVVSEA